MSGGRIPQTFLDELLTRTDIVGLIETRLRLRKAGSNYVALCPFHHEKTPSFTITPAKQIFYCFGCQVRGNAISFLMQYERLEFVDAVETLASQLGLTVPYEGGGQDAQQQAVSQALYPWLEQAARYYQAQLFKSTGAVEYLKKRGLTGAICKQFGIGFAPAGREGLARQLVKHPDHVAPLVTTGMLIQNATGEYYDRFRQRIMFPIRDMRGRVIGFGGRAIQPDDQPKYLNSPETSLFHKGQEWYGLYEARRACSPLTRVVVVEGYMDVVALVQHGISNAVATLGTAVATRQVQRLLRYCAEVVFCFDGDRAGRQAAWRALEITLPLMRDKIQVFFLLLPEGDDPDSLVRKEGTAAFSQRLTTATPLSDFFFQQLTNQVDMQTLDGRSRLFSLAQPLLQQMPSGVFRELMQQRLAEQIGISVDKLDFWQPAPALEQLGTAKRMPPMQGERIRTPLQLALSLLLQQPQLATQVNDLEQLSVSEIPGIETLVEMLTLLRQQPHLTTAALLEHWRERKEGERLGALAVYEHGVPAEGMSAEFADALTHLTDKGLQQAVDNLLKQASQQGLTPTEEQRLQSLLEKRKQWQLKKVI